ncbi:hypothetical protein Avbf_16643 [Armadillidium vulgare]|nr:hypothetical protein Avbf_16643 [Armadillidium vulgare]
MNFESFCTFINHRIIEESTDAGVSLKELLFLEDFAPNSGFELLFCLWVSYESAKLGRYLKCRQLSTV